jgi:hypothetical protein
MIKYKHMEPSLTPTLEPRPSDETILPAHDDHDEESG